MAVNYTDTPIQIASLLRILRKRHAVIEHALNAADDTTNSDRALLVVSNGFDTADTDEAKTIATMFNHLTQSSVKAARDSWRATRQAIQREDSYFGQLANDLDLEGSDRRVPIAYEYEDVNGVITITERRGVFGNLYDDMVTNTEYVTANALSPASQTAESANRGVLSDPWVAGSFLSHALSGTLVLRTEDESVDAPKLSVTLELLAPLPDGRVVLTADNLLTPDKSYSDGPLGINGVTVARSGLTSPTESGDDGAIFSSVSFATPSDSDSDKGVFHIKITRQATAPIWLVEVFSDSARDNKVGSATHDGTTGSDASQTIECSGGTVITYTIDKAAANTQLPSATNTDEDISYDIENPRLGDEWRVVITNDEAGNYSTKLMKHWPGVSLPVSGSNLWTDANASSISMS